MPPPPPTEKKNLKRPRGLLGSRKSARTSAESSPKAKKPRAEDPEEDLDQDALNLQDWNDLKELYQNALDAFYGSDPTTALPLVRGVLHECASLVSAHNDPTMIYLPIEKEEKSALSEPASAFYVIYASAWVLMSTFARADESLMAADEPKTPMAYVLSALSACELGQKALNTRNQERKVWDLEFVWGQALIGAAESLLDSEEDLASDQPTSASVSELQGATRPDRTALTGPNPSAAFERAVESLLFAIKNYPQEVEADETDEKTIRDNQFARGFLNAAQATLSVAEQLQSGDENESTEEDDNDGKSTQRLYRAREIFTHLGNLNLISPGVRVRTVFGETMAGLVIGAAIAEDLEDGGDTSSTLRDEAIRILKE
ncbi:hypothetical protein BDV93DRAFT_529664, partial [Ceratobasidium sp. AG-I]